MSSLVAADYGSSESEEAISDEESCEKINYPSNNINEKQSFSINNDEITSDDEKSSTDDRNDNW